MKLTRKIKAIILIFNIVLIIFGLLFVKSLFKNSQKKHINDEVCKEQVTTEKVLIDELTTCKSELFTVKNELERQKIMPDMRKDAINLLLALHDFEKKIGNKTDFSSNCISIFAYASRIPIVQEFVLKYKEQMFKTNCNFANNEQIIKMILPFQIKALEVEANNEKKGKKWYKRFIGSVKYRISKLFVKSKIQKSDIEIAIENYNYNEAIALLISSNFEKNNEFNKLYDAISVLNNSQQMVNGIYDILRINN